MTELYGSAFKAAYGDNPTPIWERSIAELTDDQCRDGLTRLAKQPREYPANLTQFIAACKPPSPGVRFLGRPLTPEEMRLLIPPPEKRASTEKIDGWLAKMRRTVGAANSAAADQTHSHERRVPCPEWDQPPAESGDC